MTGTVKKDQQNAMPLVRSTQNTARQWTYTETVSMRRGRRILSHERNTNRGRQEDMAKEARDENDKENGTRYTSRCGGGSP